MVKPLMFIVDNTYKGIFPSATCKELWKIYVNKIKHLNGDIFLCWWPADPKIKNFKMAKCLVR